LAKPAVLILIQIKDGGFAFVTGMIQIKAAAQSDAHRNNMWMDISTAPKDRPLSLAVIDAEGLHSLVFPCRRVADGWINAANGLRVDVRPTHWREWTAAVSNPIYETAAATAKT